MNKNVIFALSFCGVIALGLILWVAISRNKSTNKTSKPSVSDQKSSEETKKTPLLSHDACEILNERDTLEYLVYDKIDSSKSDICFTIGQDNLSYFKSFPAALEKITKPVYVDYSIINYAVDEIFKNPKLTDIPITVMKSDGSFDTVPNESVLSRKLTKFESITIGQAYSKTTWEILTENFDGVDEIVLQYNCPIDHDTIIADFQERSNKGLKVPRIVYFMRDSSQMTEKDAKFIEATKAQIGFMGITEYSEFHDPKYSASIKNSRRLEISTIPADISVFENSIATHLVISTDLGETGAYLLKYFKHVKTLKLDKNFHPKILPFIPKTVTDLTVIGSFRDFSMSSIAHLKDSLVKIQVGGNISDIDATIIGEFTNLKSVTFKSISMKFPAILPRNIEYLKLLPSAMIGLPEMSIETDRITIATTAKVFEDVFDKIEVTSLKFEIIMQEDSLNVVTKETLSAISGDKLEVLEFVIDPKINEKKPVRLLNKKGLLNAEKFKNLETLRITGGDLYTESQFSQFVQQFPKLSRIDFSSQLMFEGRVREADLVYGKSASLESYAITVVNSKYLPVDISKGFRYVLIRKIPEE
jgi:hypothetical protein